MTSKQRMRAAMSLATPDRVPVMCQLALGHYFLHAGLDPFDVWFTSEGFAEALVRLAERYRFDGVLINLPGRPPDIRSYVDRVDRGETEDIVTGATAAPRACRTTTTRYVPPPDRPLVPPFEQIDPDRLFYVEPWDATGRSTRSRGISRPPRAPKAISSRPTARNDQGRVATGRRSALRALGGLFAVLRSCSS